MNTKTFAPLIRTTMLISTVALAAVSSVAAQTVTTPEEHFGFAIGDDYQLATYTQFASYWRTLERESPRMVVAEIGRTAEDRPQLIAIVTSPENHARLERYREISTRLALGTSTAASSAPAAPEIT